MTARILIIEDEALVAMELRFVLEDLGHEVVGTAADAKAAHALAAETEIDLALVDIHLSDGATGIELQLHRRSGSQAAAHEGLPRTGPGATLRLRDQ